MWPILRPPLEAQNPCSWDVLAASDLLRQCSWFLRRRPRLVLQPFGSLVILLFLSRAVITWRRKKEVAARGDASPSSPTRLGVRDLSESVAARVFLSACGTA